MYTIHDVCFYCWQRVREESVEHFKASYTIITYVTFIDRGYFKDPWNIIEVIFFFMAFVSVGMYGSKEAYTRYITKKISEDKGQYN